MTIAYKNYWHSRVNRNKGVNVINSKNIRWTILCGLVICKAAFAETDSFDCVMEPSDIVEISSPVQGLLESVAVDRGQFVKKGQVVAKLHSGVEAANLELAKARASLDVDVHSRKAEYEMKNRLSKRLEDLYDKKFASERDVDDAKTSGVVAEYDFRRALALKDISRLEMLQAQEVLNQRILKSTVDGVVVEKMKSPGEFIEEQPVLKIARIDPIYVEVIVPVQRLGEIRAGMSGNVTSEKPMSKTYSAQVTVVDPVVHASSGTFGVRLTLPNPDGKIPVGLRCKVSF